MRFRVFAKLQVVIAIATGAVLLAYSPALAKTALDEGSAPDPFERVNRVLFYANGALDFIIIRPAAMTYKRVMPRPIRAGLENAFSNLGEPAIAINDMLQGHGKKAIRTVARFATNSTIGVAGLFDVAKSNGLPHHRNDFGITLARSGVPSGPYLFLPLVGPATARDTAGYLVNFTFDPLTYIRFPQSSAVGVGRTIGTGLADRANSDKVVKVITDTSTDLYASIRAYYLQNREAQISGGKIDLDSLPSFDAPPADPLPDGPK